MERMLAFVTSPWIVLLTGGAWSSGVANSRFSARSKAGDRRFAARLEWLSSALLLAGELMGAPKTELPTVSRLAEDALLKSWLLERLCASIVGKGGSGSSGASEPVPIALPE
jgi:hypothetical protein